MSDKQNILLTGGAGYIGAHVYYALEEAGYVPVVIDNLSTGSRGNLPADTLFYEGDIADEALVSRILREHGIRAVMHFAGSTNVAESIEEPEFYYQNNVKASEKLLSAAQISGVEAFVFSSSAAVYGCPEEMPVREDMEVRPISPYGQNKLDFERILADAPMAAAALRYFNVAGADAMGRCGPTQKNQPHVVGAAVAHIVNAAPSFKIFGYDYDTPDGSCIRDFIHVSDLADIHVKALVHLMGGSESFIMNCGYGRGVSIKALADKIGNFMDDPCIIEVARREGDIVESCADVTKLKDMLGWTPRHDDLSTIIESEIAWVRNKKKAA